MKHLNHIVFSILFILMAPIQAADEVTEAVQSEASVADNNSGIVSQKSPLLGYQPLTVAGQEIEATYLEETLGERHGAIILLHDQGEDLEGQGVITPLRHQLPQYGWSTLTLVLDYPFEPAILLSVSTEPSTLENASGAEPAVEAETAPETEEDAKPEGEESKTDKSSLPPISNKQRVEAAIALVQAKGIERIIFLGHGAGGDMAVNLLDEITIPISALILVGTPDLTNYEAFKDMQQPIFDLYGNQDLVGVPIAVQKRKTTMKRTGNTRYSAREVMGANHQFSGLQTTLIDTTRGWLKVMFVEPKKD